MPYITFSRNAKVPRRKLLGACERLGSLFEHSEVVMRGNKSVRRISSDAASKGFSRVIILRDGLRALSVLKVQNLGRGYAWGKAYSIKTKKDKQVIERDAKDAQKTLIREASD
jgi:hypothetical protein